jgi:vitamin B12 transporter
VTLGRWSLAGLLVFGLGPPSAHGDPDSPVQPLQADPVVVTATRTEVPLGETTTSISVISRPQMEARQTPDLVDLLQTVPGLHVVESSTRGGFSIVQPRGAPFTHNLVLIDGVRVSGAGGVFTWGDFSTVGIERIEILRGPQSALYGIDAIGSVIQVFTLSGHGPPRLDISAGAGNENTFEESAILSGSNGPVGYSLAVGRIDTDGSLPVNSGFHATTVSGRLDYRPRKDLDLSLTMRGVQSEVGFPIISGGDRFFPLDPNRTVDQTRMLVSARGSHWPASWWQQTLQLGYVFTGGETEDPPTLNPVGVRSENDERHYAAEYAWNFFVPPVLEVASVLTAGLAAERDQFEQRVTVAGSSSTLDESRSSYSGYVQAQLSWRERAFVTGGFRVDDSSEFGIHVTPRVSAGYVLPGLATKLRGAYSQGLKAPTFVQEFGDGSGLVLPSPGLQPERARSWEIGLDQPIGNDLAQASLTFFHSRLDDLIAFVPVVGGGPGGQTAVRSLNLQSARVQGVELTLAVRLPYGFSLLGGYTYLDTQILDNGGVDVSGSPVGAPLPLQPAHSGSVTLQHAWNRLRATVAATFIGDSQDVDQRSLPPARTRLPGYTRIDAALSYTLLQGQWGFKELSLFGRVRNLLNADYQPTFGATAPPLTFVVGLRGSF